MDGMITMDGYGWNGPKKKRREDIRGMPIRVNI
jgi:hypothetical protein